MVVRPEDVDIVPIEEGQVTGVVTSVTFMGVHYEIIVDVGVNVSPEGKLCGDVRFDQAEPVVEAISPVPGGVGSVTTLVLCKHVIQAAERALGIETGGQT